MSVEIKVPTLGESVTEATVAQWMKKEGDAVEADEAVVELETDKVTLEVNAPAAGVIAEIKHGEGDDVEVGDILGTIEEGDGAAAKEEGGKEEEEAEEEEKAAADAEGDEDEKKQSKSDEEKEEEEKKEKDAGSDKAAEALSPAVRKLVEEHDLDPSEIEGTGKDGRLTKGDVEGYLEARDKDEKKEESGAEKDEKEEGKSEPEAEKKPEKKEAKPREVGEREERVRMSRLRQRIAERLKEAQDTAAMLTTFNDADMTAVMESRELYKDAFEKKHGVKLEFMSFFVKACIVALKEIPAVNAEIDGTDIIYKNHYDIGVAVGTEQGLVVPVVRDADAMSFGEIEAKIAELGGKARSGDLSMDDLTGGTFTISNGGIYGSMLSTPILNLPQSGILGMHRIEKRPVVIDDEIVVRPMMYLALSYDHRIVDGREAVTFLKRVKECLEDPQRILLDM